LNKPEPEEQENAPYQQEDEGEAPAEVGELYGYEYGAEEYGAEQE
jgi:hypothetical protein